MNKQEIAALRDLMALTGEALKDVRINSRDSTFLASLNRVIALHTMADGLEIEMRIALKHPSQRDLPLNRIRQETGRLRTRLAEMAKASTPAPAPDIVQSPTDG